MAKETVAVETKQDRRARRRVGNIDGGGGLGDTRDEHVGDVHVRVGQRMVYHCTAGGVPSTLKHLWQNEIITYFTAATTY